MDDRWCTFIGNVCRNMDYLCFICIEILFEQLSVCGTLKTGEYRQFQDCGAEENIDNIAGITDNILSIL